MPVSRNRRPRLQGRTRLAIAIPLLGVAAGIASEAVSDGPFDASDAVFRAAFVAVFIVAWELVTRALARRDET